MKVFSHLLCILLECLGMVSELFMFLLVLFIFEGETFIHGSQLWNFVLFVHQQTAHGFLYRLFVRKEQFFFYLHLLVSLLQWFFIVFFTPVVLSLQSRIVIALLPIEFLLRLYFDLWVLLQPIDLIFLFVEGHPQLLLFFLDLFVLFLGKLQLFVEIEDFFFCFFELPLPSA